MVVNHPDPILELRELRAGHDGVEAVRKINLTVAPGEIVALLGPNGAGKTTILETISGLARLMGGEVLFDGTSTCKVPAHLLARRGLALVPDSRGIFHQLSAAENLQLAPRPASAPEVDEMLDQFAALRGLLSRRAGLLSGGEQQMLALAKALLGKPKLLMIDEMSHGLAPVVVERLFPIISRASARTGMSVLLVEQHVPTALQIASRACVLNHGRVVLEGSTSELAQNPKKVEDAYFGTTTASTGSPGINGSIPGAPGVGH